MKRPTWKDLTGEDITVATFDEFLETRFERTKHTRDNLRELAKAAETLGMDKLHDELTWIAEDIEDMAAFTLNTWRDLLLLGFDRDTESTEKRIAEIRRNKEILDTWAKMREERQLLRKESQ